MIPGQPTNKKGKPLNYIVYNSAEVFVDDMEHVAAGAEEPGGYGLSGQQPDGLAGKLQTAVQYGTGSSWAASEPCLCL